MSVDLGSLGIEIEHMEVNFRAQRVEFKFSESIWVSLRRCWASGSQFWTSDS